MMVSKLTIALLAGALALPVAGFAAEQVVEAPKAAATAAAKPVIAAPADCKTTGKKRAPDATAKRKKAHADRGIVSGEEKLTVHNHEAAREHGKHGNNN